MRNLVDRVPADTREQLENAVAVLVQYGPLVANAVDFLQTATRDAWFASMVPASLDPAEVEEVTDEEWNRLEDALGIGRGWDAAFHLAGIIG